MCRHLVDVEAAPVTWRALFTWRKHKMIQDQLALAIEEVLQGDSAIGSLEDVFFLDLDHWHVGTEVGDFVAVACMLLLLFQELYSRFLPLLSVADLVSCK